jgi:hypothetical protein
VSLGAPRAAVGSGDQSGVSHRPHPTQVGELQHAGALNPVTGCAKHLQVRQFVAAAGGKRNYVIDVEIY